MAAGPLHPDNLTRGRDRSLGRGHGTAALGPSDSSDSGSDLHGAPGLAPQSKDIDGFGLDRPPSSDLEESFANYTAGPDIGDANMDSDSDRSGTGERAMAVRDTTVEDGADIDVDHIEQVPDEAGDLDDDIEPEEGGGKRKR